VGVLVLFSITKLLFRSVLGVVTKTPCPCFLLRVQRGLVTSPSVLTGIVSFSCMCAQGNPGVLK